MSGNISSKDSRINEQLIGKDFEGTWCVLIWIMIPVLRRKEYGKRRKSSVTTASVEPNKFRIFNTLRTGDADLRFYITTVQDG